MGVIDIWERECERKFLYSLSSSEQQMVQVLSPTVDLVHTDGWSRNEDTFVRGDMFVNGEHLRDEALLDYIKSIDDETELYSLLEKAYGYYAIIHLTKDGWHVAVDHVRRWPIFYAIDDNLVISDSSFVAHERSAGDKFDPMAASEYLFTSYVLGSNTLSKSVKQVQPGELLTFNNDGGELNIRKNRHFSYIPQGKSSLVDYNDLDKHFDRIFNRLVEHAGGRPIILPLSGGCDSRIIALKIADSGYDNVVAYTSAATKDDSDLRTAKKIADDLGFDHVVLERSYNRHEEFYRSGKWSEFQNSMGFLSELPSVNAYLGHTKLKDHPEIPNEGVVAHGHHGLVGGSKLPVWLKNRDSLSKDEFLHFIWKHNYMRWNVNPLAADERKLDQKLRERIIDNVRLSLYQDTNTESIYRAIAGIEAFFWQNRFPKYNMIHYELEGTGYDRWYPLADKEYLEFLSDIDYRFRVNKQVQREYAKKLAQKVVDNPSFSTSEFVSAMDSGFTMGVGKKTKNYVWDRSAIIMSRVPDPIKHVIKGTYYTIYGGFDGSVSNSPLQLAPTEFLDQIDLRVAHRRPLQLLLLYHDSHFYLEEKTILDNVIKPKSS